MKRINSADQQQNLTIRKTGQNNEHTNHAESKIMFWVTHMLDMTICVVEVYFVRWWPSTKIKNLTSETQIK